MATTERSVTAVLDGAPCATRITTRGIELIADEPVDHGGTDQGMRPHELLLGALASCTAITLRMYADRKGWSVPSIGITVHMDRTQEGTTIETNLKLTVELSEGLTQEQRERLVQIAKACPVHRTLENPIHITAGLGE